MSTFFTVLTGYRNAEYREMLLRRMYLYTGIDPEYDYSKANLGAIGPYLDERPFG